MKRREAEIWREGRGGEGRGGIEKGGMEVLTEDRGESGVSYRRQSRNAE